MYMYWPQGWDSFTDMFNYSLVTAELYSIGSTIISEFPDFVLDYTENVDSIIVIRRKKMSSIGPTKHPCFNPRLILSHGCDSAVCYSFEVNLESIDSGTFIGNEEKVKLWLSTMHNGRYVICPGLPVKQYPPPAKRLKTSSEPLLYQRDKDCLMWHVPSNRKSKAGSVTLNMCTPCKRLRSKLEQKLSNPVSPSVKLARTSYSSSYPQSYLSPGSHILRAKSVATKRHTLERQVNKLRSKTSVHLAPEQNNELTRIVAAIEQDHLSDVEKLMEDADKEGKGEIMRSLWRQDIKEHNDFFDDQKRNSEYMYVQLCIIVQIVVETSKKGNRWSMITIRVGIYMYNVYSY